MEDDGFLDAHCRHAYKAAWLVAGDATKPFGCLNRVAAAF
jgi:hypothetical protein